MDITVKKYEHRHLAMSVCEHKCNVGEKYVLPQAQAFGLSWSMPMDHGYSLRCTEECHLSATGWRSPTDPTGKRTVDKGQVVVPAQALELMSGNGAHRRPPARRGKGLQFNQTKRAQAR